ncbi:MAG: hypothetical protein ABIF77_21620 [bacterium]
MRSRLLIHSLLLVLVAGWTFTVPGVTAAPPQLGSPENSDSLPTNLWLAEALMAEIVTEAAGYLPAPPQSVALQLAGETPGEVLFGIVATDVLRQLGYELYLADSSPTDEVGASVPDPVPAYGFQVKLGQIDLAYPEAGKRFGIWRQWIARQMALSAVITIVANDSGRLLLNDRFQRSYRDRIPNGELATVGSAVYPFTDASIPTSGWGRRLEEIVVLGTLTGLVAIYFANTGN